MKIARYVSARGGRKVGVSNIDPAISKLMLVLIYLKVLEFRLQRTYSPIAPLQKQYISLKRHY